MDEMPASRSRARWRRLIAGISGALMLVIALAGLPQALATWSDWLKNVVQYANSDPARLMLTAMGLLLIGWSVWNQNKAVHRARRRVRRRLKNANDLEREVLSWFVGRKRDSAHEASDLLDSALDLWKDGILERSRVKERHIVEFSLPHETIDALNGFLYGRPIQSQTIVLNLWASLRAEDLPPGMIEEAQVYRGP